MPGEEGGGAIGHGGGTGDAAVRTGPEVVPTKPSALLESLETDEMRDGE